MLRAVKGVFFDIDDTFSSQGKITATAFAALWRAHRAGVWMVPVTGRPAGWADHIARFWPVRGVIAENGALATFEAGGKLRSLYLLDARTRARNRRRLEAVRREILQRVPGVGVASDQAFRLFDLAIDYCEDVSPQDPETVDKIVQIMRRRGVTAKISSIHVNGWFGRYDKLGMCQRFARQVLGVDLERQRHRFLFIGDSPNDAPMFSYFPNAVGVANLRRFDGQLEATPRFLTRGRAGRGFAEVVRAVCAAREG